MENTIQSQTRTVQQIIEPRLVVEGAGVKLKRSIGTRALDNLDPFLLWDHFGSDDPDDYRAGFPMHPHRGIETVTYILAGEVRHKDSLGNSGTIGAGDVQWMTSGSGIMHEEMPQVNPNRMEGFQLWVNLPARLKMTAPRYQGVLAESIPALMRPGGVSVHIIAGTVDGVSGPVKDIAADPLYLDVTIPQGASFNLAVERGHTVFAYVFEGEGHFGPERTEAYAPRLVVFGDGNDVEVHSSGKGVRFILAAGKPLHEPIARYGPFVMNTSAEIEQALSDLRSGTFVKK
jgi:quercetin 2,3-dioxygenase